MHRFFPHAADPVSCGTHTIGALAAFAGGVFFLIRGVRTGAPALALACAMCFCLIAVASCRVLPMNVPIWAVA